MEKFDARKMMEQFFESGNYKMMKLAEKRKNEVRESLEKKLYDLDGNRHVFEKQGVVARFIRKKVYEVDQKGLNEYLYHIGLLPLVVEIDTKKAKEYPVLDQFLLPSEKELGVSVNKLGRYEIEPLSIGEDVDSEMLVNQYVYYHRIHEDTVEVYEKLKKKIMDCPILWEQQKIQHKYGSVYLKNSSRKKYDIFGIMDELGSEFLIEVGKPNQSKLETFIQSGSLSYSDINQFRKVIDYRIEFRIMSLEKEEKMLSFLHEKRMKAAIQSV